MTTCGAFGPVAGTSKDGAGCSPQDAEELIKRLVRPEAMASVAFEEVKKELVALAGAGADPTVVLRARCPHPYRRLASLFAVRT